MELALLVYAISLLSGIGTFFGITIIALIGVSIGIGIYVADSDEKSYYTDTKNVKRAANAIYATKWLWRNLCIGIAAAWVIILLPSEKTAYTMVGAYAAQKIAQDPKVEQMGSKVLVIINQKLDGYITEGLDKADKAVKDKVNK
jgi:hypothetical protein